MISPFDAWAVRRALVGRDPDGTLAGVSPRLRPLVEYLGSLPSPALREGAWQRFVRGCNDRDELVRAVDGADPDASPPTSEAVRRSAHLGDLARGAAGRRFAWPGWIVRGRFNLLGSAAKVGKTHLMLDLARRLWFGAPLPDGQDAPFPPRTCTLWVCGGRRQDELREHAGAFGLPDEAVRLSARPGDPYGGWDLGDPENVALLRELMEAERPGLVIIDPFWRTARRPLRREDAPHTLLASVLETARATDTAIVRLVHLGVGDNASGRRLEGLARSVMTLERPDPERQPARRRLSVIGNFKEPPPLGVTFLDDRCEYDLDPPSGPGPSRRGRPPDKLARAVAFLSEKLAGGGQPGVELVREWEALGETKATLFNARKAMQADGRLSVDDAQTLQVWQMVQDEAPARDWVVADPSEVDPGQESAECHDDEH